MIKLESGPATKDRNYWLIMTIVAFGLTAYFLYDGFYGYPQANLAEARKLLNVEGQLTLEILGEHPTKDDAEKIRTEKLNDPEEIRNRLGKPIAVENVGPGQLRLLYASQYGRLVVPVINDRVDATGVQWQAWKYDKGDIQGQFYSAIAGTLGLLFFLYRTIRAATLRVVIDDDGVRYANRQIPWDAIQSVRDYNRKGWVDMYYATAAGEKRVRIDNQKVARFNEIVDTICQEKGFENPLPPTDQQETDAPTPEGLDVQQSDQDAPQQNPSDADTPNAQDDTDNTNDPNRPVP